ncbi:helix-turn-helix transcriptional regulator [Methylobacterium oryzisoli]|uniref:helix-turn-helix transcriptional regulator n=1 Tax=Methylobacterium oryzisoli TaxID=3385502 RepID=UPI00389204F0
MSLTQSEFSDLVARIYACVAEPHLWPDTLAGIVEAAGLAVCVACLAGLPDPVCAPPRAVREGAVDRDLLAALFAGLCPLQVVAWLEAGAGPFPAARRMPGAGHRGGHPHVPEAARAVMRLLLPHVRQALETGQRLAERDGESRGLGAAVDALCAGVILLDGAGRILRTNAAADTILREGSVLRRIASGGLAARDPAAQEGLEAALAACRLGAAPPAPALPFPPNRAASGRGLVGRLVRLRDPGSDVADAPGPVAALFVQDPDQPCAVPGEALVRLYGLTGGELRVLLGLVQDLTLNEIAQAYGIGVATVRTHLARLFDKTGTRRQAELLRVVMASAPALRPPEAPVALRRADALRVRA